MAKRPEQGTQEDEIRRSNDEFAIKTYLYTCPACTHSFYYCWILEPNEYPSYCPCCGFDNDPAHRNCEENQGIKMDEVLNTTTNAAKREGL